MPMHRDLNERFFDSWTPESAYILGLLMADGTLTTNPRGSQYVEFVSTDKELVDLFRSLLKSNHKVALKKRPASQRHCKPAYRIQIGNKKMLFRLSKMGLARKNIVPRMPKLLYRDFVRGFFDGDGCVTFSPSYFRKDRNRMSTYLQVLLTSKYRRFLQQVHSKLGELALVKGGSLYEGGRAYRLRYSQKDVLKLFLFLYKGSRKKLMLSRKHGIFKKAYHYFNGT